MKKILALLLALTMVLSLAACGSKPKEPSKPAEIAAAVLDAIRKQDSESLKKYYVGDVGDFEISGEDMGLEDKEAAEKMMKKLLDFDYKLGEAKENGDKATVTAEFKTYDIGKAFGEFMSEYLAKAFALAFSGEEDAEAKMDELSKEMTKALGEKLDGLKDKTISTSGDLKLTKTDGKWLVDEFDEEFVNAMFGDLEKAMEDVMGDMFDFGDEEEPDESLGN